MTKIVLVVIVALCMEILDLVSTLLGSPLVYTLFTPWTLLKLRINPEAVFHESSLRAFAVLAFVLYIHFETVFGSLITKGDNTVVRFVREEKIPARDLRERACLKSYRSVFVKPDLRLSN